MSIYHCSIKIIGRSDGKSAVASSAYRSGEKLMASYYAGITKNHNGERKTFI